MSRTRVSQPGIHAVAERSTAELCVLMAGYAPVGALWGLGARVGPAWVLCAQAFRRSGSTHPQTENGREFGEDLQTR